MNSLATHAASQTLIRILMRAAHRAMLMGVLWGMNLSPTAAQSLPIDVVELPHAGRIQPQNAEATHEVALFFWYACPHCAQIQPQWRVWQTQHPQVNALSIPASWNDTMVAQQRLYYTLQQLKRLDVHERVFADTHNAQYNGLKTENDVALWAQKMGFNPQQWRKMYRSALVTQRVLDGQTAFKRLQLNRVPALVVDGRHQIIIHPDALSTAHVLVTPDTIN